MRKDALPHSRLWVNPPSQAFHAVILRHREGCVNLCSREGVCPDSTVSGQTAGDPDWRRERCMRCNGSREAEQGLVTAIL